MNTLKSLLFWKIFIINLVIMVALLGMVFFMSQIALPELAKEKYKDITDETAVRLHDQIHNITLELQELGEQIQIDSREGDVRRLQNRIETAVNYSSFVDSATIVESSGEITGYYPRDLEDALKNQNFSDRNYVQKAITTKEIYISNIVSAITNRFVVVVAIPILNNDGEVLRVVNLVIRIGENPIFHSIIKNLQIGDGYASYIVDREGTVLSHLLPERIGEDQSSNPVVQKVLDEKSGYEQVTSTRDISMLASYKYIPTLEWGVVAQVPESSTKVFFKTFQDTFFLLSLVLFIFLSVLTALYTKQIIKPIKELERAVGQVAKGNFNERISVKHIDNTEIGKLSKRYNEMAEYIVGANEKIEIKEKLLMEQKEFLRKILDTSPNFIYVKNSKGQYTLVNNAFANLYGKSVEKMLLKSEVDINSDVEQVNRHMEEDLSVMDTLEEKYIGEENLIDINGDKKWVLTTKIPLQLMESSDVHILCISNDISERKLVEETIRKSDKLNVVGELAAGVAHEIRNPITSIQGFLQFIKPNNKDERYFDIMLSEIERIKLIINEMLVLAKPQAKKSEMKDVREICQSIIYLFEPQSNLKNIEIVTDFDSDIPEIWCGANELKQVFVNVLKNAIESMVDGGQIYVQIKKRDEENIIIRFVDQGVGIDEERLDHLGEPFYSTKEKGTGLGLMVSYRIIEQHKGKIKISSKKNQGTTVDVILPINHQ